VTGLAASVALSTTTTGSTTETGGTASSGSSGAGRGNVTLLSTGVTRLSLGGRALVVSSVSSSISRTNLSGQVTLLTTSVTGWGARLGAGSSDVAGY
jgi:hypothetical protein